MTNTTEFLLAVLIVFIVLGATYFWLGFRKETDVPDDVTDMFKLFDPKK